MFAVTAHGHARWSSAVAGMTGRLHSLWMRVAEAFAAPAPPCEIDWEDGEGY